MKTIIALLAVAFVFLQYKLWFEQGNIMEMMALHRAIARQTNENNQLTLRNQSLQLEVNDLKTAHNAIEEHARAELGMIKNGETYYQIIESTPPTGHS